MSILNACPSAASPEEMPRGAWAFDRRTRELVYRVNHDAGFRPAGGGAKEIRLAVIAARESDLHGSLLGVALVERSRYDWQ